MALELLAEEVIGQLPPLRAGGNGMARHHEVVVEIECDDPQGQRQAQDRLERWISTFGHTAGGHGFAFVESAPPGGVEELREHLEPKSVSTAVGTKKTADTKKTTKVDRDAEIVALAEHVSKVTKKWIGKDKREIRGALKVTMAGFGCGVYQVVNLYESTASTDARTVL